MESNTEFHRWLGCPFSLHKLHVDPVTTPDEAVVNWWGGADLILRRER